MSNIDLVLMPLKKSFRAGRLDHLENQASKAMRTAADPLLSVQDKALIMFETSKAYRLLGKLSESVALVETTLDNLPPGSLSLMAALKRVRVLLFLDGNDLASAQVLVDQIDAPEMVIRGESKTCQRQDADVHLETWLVSVEMALAQGNVSEAKVYFGKAIERLKRDENEVKGARLNMLDSRRMQELNNDMRMMAGFLGAAIRLQENDLSGLQIIKGFDEKIKNDNSIVASNAALIGKLQCLTGEWNAGSPVAPVGLNVFEARRWASFRKPIEPTAPVSSVIDAPDTSIVPVTLIDAENAESSTNDSQRFQNQSASANLLPHSLTDVSVATLSVLERVTSVLERLEGNGTAQGAANGKHMFSPKIAFGGNLLTFDLMSLLYNAFNIVPKFTGYIKLTWEPENYQTSMILGKISTLVAAGEAILFLVDGWVIDVSVGADTRPSANAAEAQVKLDFLVQIVYCIGLSDDTKHEIVGGAVLAEQVRERPSLLLNVNHETVMNSLSRQESLAAGFGAELEQEEKEQVLLTGMTDDAAFDAAFGSTDISPVADSIMGKENPPLIFNDDADFLEL